MPGSIIQTKLFVPRRRGTTVPRPRLSDRLSRGIDARLTLVSAPAGFGKTTLLASWLASAPRPEVLTAWLSLDQSDNDPTTFWTYVIAALQTVAPAVGAGSLALIEAAQTPIEVVLGALLNELNAFPNDLVLVLDDYHVIDDHRVHDGMAFFVDRLPPHVHLVIASRADPPLPLARLRARGELVEIRAAELRFTPDEAAEYFNDVMALDLAATELAILAGRTEGWIAALQLAALSMQGRDNVAEFIKGFAGDDRYIVDYLVEEVLQRQPEHIREFLLQTSVLNRLTGPLCDAVTEQDGGKAMLEALDRANLFLVALDDRRQWYRYHHLFADVLRAHLAQYGEQPDQVVDLHRRASTWYERNAERPEAIRHALSAGDFGHAADLVELEWPALARARQEVTLRGWLDALPDELLRCRPVLSNAYAGLLLSNGELEGVDQRLRDAERWLAPGQPSDAQGPGMVVANEDEFRTLPGSVAVHRAGYALARGNLVETVNHARRALDLAPEDDRLTRGGATALMGLAAWANGDLETAYRSYADGMADVQRGGHLAGTVGRAITLADIRVAQGRLGDAMRTYAQALQLASEQGGAVVRGTADVYVGMSEVQRERNELDAATQSLLMSQELGEQSGFAQNLYRLRVAMALIREARGDLDGALNLLGSAQPEFMIDFSPNVRPIAAMHARVLVRQGRTGEALGWAREHGISVEDDLSYVREYEHITLARTLLTSGSAVQAAELLDRLLKAAEHGGRAGSMIEILVLQALANDVRGDKRAALVPFERALTLAEPEGYVRKFVDEGPGIVALLQAAAKRGIAPGYAQRLLTHSGATTGEPHAKQNLVEPLSERELDVLRLLATDLDGPEIASQLMVSLNTMRTHTKSIYTKFGVNNRRAAVHRAEELALLSQTPTR
ncbi:MAG: LuxR C-terminal-related transcriptional regulator [Chloroflexota bacterium]|nr:LuxR C-terminal-related transcriptional regulator [Chloroflexota bacterium]